MEKRKPRRREPETRGIKSGGVKRRGAGLGTGPVGNKGKEKPRKARPD